MSYKPAPGPALLSNFRTLCGLAFLLEQVSLRKICCVGEEKMSFQAKRTNDYFVKPNGLDKMMCLIYKHFTAMLKDFNINHYVTNYKNYDKYIVKELNNNIQ